MCYNVNDYRDQVPYKGTAERRGSPKVVLWRDKGESGKGGLNRKGEGDKWVKKRMQRGTTDSKGLLKNHIETCYRGFLK